MRELIGKIPTKDPNITEMVYRTEMVRCLECQRTAPMGIEVVTVKKSKESKEVVRHVCYCRGHGFDYETKAQSLPSSPLCSIRNVVAPRAPNHSCRIRIIRARSLQRGKTFDGEQLYLGMYPVI